MLSAQYTDDYLGILGIATPPLEMEDVVLCHLVGSKDDQGIVRQ